MHTTVQVESACRVEWADHLAFTRAGELGIVHRRRAWLFPRFGNAIDPLAVRDNMHRRRITHQRDRAAFADCYRRLIKIGLPHMHGGVSVATAGTSSSSSATTCDYQHANHAQERKS